MQLQITLQSIIQAFVLHSYILQYPMILLIDSKGPDQIAQISRLIGSSLSHMPEDMFSHGGAHRNSVA